MVAKAAGQTGHCRFLSEVELKAIYLAAAVAMLAGPTSAGPDATAQFLMNESASMLDIGILKLQLALDGQAFPFYSWDENAILLSSFNFSEKGTAEDLEKMCSDWVSGMRLRANVSLETGKPFYGDVSTFSFNFQHVGFERNSPPKDLLKKIDALFLLNCGRGEVRVTAPLLGTGYALQK